MGVEVNIVESKFLNQFQNGDDFLDSTGDTTPNLAASVMEKMKIIQQVDVSWDSEASESDRFDVDATNLTLIRTGSGSFINDGFSVGDKFDLLQDYDDTQVFDFQGEITSVSDSTIIFTVISGTPSSTVLGYINAGIRGLTPLEGLIYNFGLIDNNANFSITSNATGSDQGYYAAGIGADSGSGRSTSFVDLQRLGSNKDWITGSAKCRYVSNPSTYVQRFEIEHEFTVVPYYKEGELENLQDNVIPDLLAGLNSLKYVYEPKFRTTISNPNTEKSVRLERNLGSVAWFNENFNGFNNNYQVNSISYKEAATSNSADGVIIGSKTEVRVEVKNLVGDWISGGERAGVYVSYLPNQDEYENTTLTDFNENFLYDNALNNEGLTAVDGSNNIISNFRILPLDDDELTLIFDVEYSSLQKAFLSQRNSEEDIYFIIGVQLGDATLSSGNSDRVTLLADVNTYDESADIPDLIVNPSFNLFPYKEVVGVDTGFTSLVQWNEDGFTMQGSFDLNLNKDAVLNTLEFRLVAENSTIGSFFELDSFVFNVANPVVVNGVQQFNLVTTRGYNLEAGSQFNDVSLTNGGLSAGLQTYNLRFSQKISWQDWIANNLVDSVFYDNSKINDNFNDKSSNYSDLNGYNIKLSMFSNLSGTSDLGVGGITDYHILTSPITVYDYDLDGNTIPEWSGTIQTFNPVNSTDLDGAILTSQDTLFKITWVNVNGAITDLTDITAIHRIEETNQNGYDIDEVGTLYSFPSSNRIIPKSGFTNLDMYLDSGNVITECLINGSQLNTGIGYNLSGKIEVESTVDPNGKLMSPSNESKDTSGTVETKVEST